MQRIFVAGGRGLTGKSLESVAYRYPNFDLFYHCRDLGDLTDSRVVQKVLGDLNPELIILNAASLAGAHGSKTEQQMYSIRNYTIHENFTNLATINQKVICYSSYHVFGGLAPFSNVNALNLNYESDYATEKSREIEASLVKSNVKFIIFPHLFGRYDSFKVNRAHFIANSIRRIISAEKNKQREIQFFGNRKRLLQFASGIQSATFVLNLLSDKDLLDENIYDANIGWVVEIGKVFDEICKLVGYDGKVSYNDAELNSKLKEKDMYFKNNAILSDVPLKFTEELVKTIDYYKREVEKF